MATAAAPRPLRLPCAPPPGALAPELEAALAPDEAAPSFLSRTSADPVPTGLPLVGSLRPGEVLEFVGPSGCGKTALLVQVKRREAREAKERARSEWKRMRFLFFFTLSLFQQVAAATILPAAWEGTAVGGRGGE